MPWLLFTFLMLLSGPAWADSGMLLAGVANRQMPLDALTVPTACYSERRLRTAYTANKGVNIVRASDSTTSDIGFTPAGYPDKASETTFCNATTCKLVTIYDQCGSNNLTQATDANRFVRVAGPGSFNANQATAAVQTHVGGSNITPATGLASLSMVANRSSGTGVCALRENGVNNRLQVTSAAANSWTLQGGTSGAINRTASDNAWHAGVGVINGASAVLSIDTAEGTGTATGNTTAGAPSLSGSNTTTCNFLESVIWDNVALSAGERTYIAKSQRAAWGF